jgi:hypothetical protein
MIERTIFLTDKNKNEMECVITIGAPYRRETGEWACPNSLKGLYENLLDTSGEDSFQALVLSLNLIRTLLENFVSDGGVILDAKNGNPLNLDVLFKTGSIS